MSNTKDPRGRVFYVLARPDTLFYQFSIARPEASLSIPNVFGEESDSELGVECLLIGHLVKVLVNLDQTTGLTSIPNRLPAEARFTLNDRFHGFTGDTVLDGYTVHQGHDLLLCPGYLNEDNLWLLHAPVR